MEKIKILIEQLEHARGIELPAYESDHAAGMDLRAALEKPIVLQPGERALIPTGLKMALPEGYEGQVRPRSGLAYRNGITMLNTPGTIDADYRGEIKVLAVNLGREPFTVRHGERIAQMVIAPVVRPDIETCSPLPETKRGDGGFGSTGLD